MKEAAAQRSKDIQKDKLASKQEADKAGERFVADRRDILLKEVLKNGQAQLEKLGIDPQKASEMAGAALKAAVSDEVVDAAGKVIDNVSSPLNYENNSVDDGARAFREAYDKAKYEKITFDQQLDEVEKTFYDKAKAANRTDEEAMLASKLMRKDAEFWAKTNGMTPEAFLEKMTKDEQSRVNLELLKDLETKMKEASSPDGRFGGFLV